MKIGLAGYGKMGRDIFSLLFDNTPGAQFVVLDTCGMEENSAALMKTLDKQLRRKKLTQEEYDAKRTAFSFTDKITDLSGCDIVIEAIFEDIRTKKSLFGELAGIVGSDCLLLTNTSSLSINDIFADIPHRERCFGMHFFYPVKLTGFVELNVLPENTDEYIARARALAEGCGKKAIVFTGEYHIYLNQILSCMVAHAIYLRDTMGVSVAELQRAMAELYPIADAFEILDSVGLGLMAGKPDNFRIARNKELLGYSFTKMNEWLAEGCPKETGTFLSFISEKEQETGRDCSGTLLSMISVILCELVNAAADTPGCGPELLSEAVRDTLGIAEPPSYYYEKFGSDAIFAELDRLYAASGFGTYKRADKTLWDSVFNA